MIPICNYSDNGYGNKYSSYLPSISIVFYMILLTSSVSGQKLISINGIVISAGSMLFQLSYMIIVCITELYGLKQARKIIITGAACNLFAAFYLYLIVKIPEATFWLNQDIFSKVILIISNILVTSTVAYVISEMTNATIISKLKLFFTSKFFIMRAICSTTIASFIDATFMLPVIISHSPNRIIVIYFSLILIKIVFSIILIPVIWILVLFLKRKEFLSGDDSFIPFSSVSYIKNKGFLKSRITD